MNVSDNLWNNLLDLKNSPVSKTSFGWSFDGQSFSEIHEESSINSNIQALLLNTQNASDINVFTEYFKQTTIPFQHLAFFASPSLPLDIHTILLNYWPLSVLSHLNTKLPYIFIHAAISLDGYLATSSGHSHWIGNDENLVHAHRLRALLDGVLIGGNTVLNDKPSLNVRHVSGENPKRLILSNRCEDLSSLQDVSNCETYLLRDSEFQYDDCANQFDKIISFEGSSKKDKMLDLLQKCKQENISSILVEGGGSTLSTFIETKLAKVIQFHMSPMLFGCGIKAVTLPTVDLVNDTHKLKDMQVTPIGNSFMVTAGLL